MLRKVVAALLIGAVGGIIGYSIGAISGFRVAVHDYYQNDAQKIEEHAKAMFDDDVPEDVKQLLEEKTDDEEKDEGRTAFR